MGCMQWTVETLNETINQELEALPSDLRARFVRVVDLIESVGLERVGHPMSDIFEDHCGKFVCRVEMGLPELYMSRLPAVV